MRGAVSSPVPAFGESRWGRPPGETVLLLDASGRVEAHAVNAPGVLGWPEADLAGRQLDELIPDSWSRYLSGEGEALYLEGRRADGRSYPLCLVNASIGLRQEALRLAIVRDLSQEESTQAEYRRLAMALEQSEDAIVITDSEGTIQFANTGFERITGYGREEVIGQKPSLLKSGHHSQEFYANLWRTIKAGKPFRGTIANLRKSGELFYELKTISPVHDTSGGITHYVSTARDVTRQVKAEERLVMLANYDPITGLPNRNLLLDRLSQSIAQVQRHGGHVALLFLDMDRFKGINDSLGHAAGDALLVEVSRRLRACVREEDTVARLGGDEFILMLVNLRRPEHSVRILEKLMAAFEKPFIIQGQAIYATPSVGVSHYPRDGGDPDTLLMNADIAMYQAKAAGRNNYRYYQPSMGSRAKQDLIMEMDLRMALPKGQFHLVYQPQVDLLSGERQGAEALMRWNHPEKGMISPVQFIPLLEGLDLMDAVGNWVIRTACEQWQSLRASGLEPGTLAINLSCRQFRNPGLASQIERAIQDTQIPPDHLEFEITENTMMENTASTARTLAALSDLGVGIAVDDFGTGYSSLSYLKRFRVNRLKIDRSFVWDATTNEDAAAIVKAILSLARSLNIGTVAEGVETESQLDFLRQHGCDSVQGYLFSPPRALVDIATLCGMPALH